MLTRSLHSSGKYLLEASIYQRKHSVEALTYSKKKSLLEAFIFFIKQILTRRPGRHGGGPADRPSGGSPASPASCQAPGNLRPQTRRGQRTAIQASQLLNPKNKKPSRKPKNRSLGLGLFLLKLCFCFGLFCFVVFCFLVVWFLVLFFILDFQFHTKISKFLKSMGPEIPPHADVER